LLDMNIRERGLRLAGSTAARRFASASLLTALFTGAAACGSDSPAASSGGDGAGGAAFAPAAHTPFPVLVNQGGPVLDEAELITITFPDFVDKDAVEQFGDWFMTSDFYTTMGAEYGLKAGRHLAKVALPDDVPKSDGALRHLLIDRIADGTLPDPAQYGQAMYVAYLPPGAKWNGGVPFCGAAAAYHDVFEVNGVQATYAIVGDCEPMPDYGAVSNASHEIIEMATDPFITGWYVNPGKTDAWHYMYDDEIADMCEYFPIVMVDGFPLTRYWSNEAAKADKNPCLPVPDDDPVYREVSSDPATIVHVKPGESTTFTLTGWSTAPTDPWAIFAEVEPAYSDFTYYHNKITLDLGTKILGNGDTSQLTVTMPTGVASGKTAIIGIYSDKTYGEAWYIGVVSD
jgi:hypothetical protein